jgi:hypothetical protein
MVLQRFRKRLPLVAFILLAVVCLLLLGFACACLTDHPMQAIERALGALSSVLAIVEVWPLIVLSLFAAVAFLGVRQVLLRPSPALLQRFLL